MRAPCPITRHSAASSRAATRSIASEEGRPVAAQAFGALVTTNHMCSASDGRTYIETADGKEYTLTPGVVVLAEDWTGKGQTYRFVASGKQRACVLIQINVGDRIEFRSACHADCWPRGRVGAHLLPSSTIRPHPPGSPRRTGGLNCLSAHGAPSCVSA